MLSPNQSLYFAHLISLTVDKDVRTSHPGTRENSSSWHPVCDDVTTVFSHTDWTERYDWHIACKYPWGFKMITLREKCRNKHVHIYTFIYIYIYTHTHTLGVSRYTNTDDSHHIFKIMKYWYHVRNTHNIVYDNICVSFGCHFVSTSLHLYFAWNTLTKNKACNKRLKRWIWLIAFFFSNFL